ncbi:MAG TPA: cytochrome c maturation protein CcmE [Gaiellaceae bacterium]
MRRSPARLVIALSVAAALAVFILYTSVAGTGTPQLQPSELAAHPQGHIMLVGTVVGAPAGDAHAAGGLHFTLKDAKGRNTAARVPVSYTGTVPDLFRTGREVVVEGSLRNGTFVANPGTLSTKCPSKYAPAPAKKST